MNNQFNEKETDHILEFIGYGRIDADIWFLGFEETISNINQLRPRLKFQAVEDIASAQKALKIPSEQFFQENIQSVWYRICEIMLKLEKRDPNPDDIRAYSENYLGREQGSTLICEFLPIPRPEKNLFEIHDVFPRFESKEHYFSQVKPYRQELFQNLIHQSSPKIILAHGKAAWPDYQEIFQGIKFSESGSCSLGWDTNTVYILCDDLSGQGPHEISDEIVAHILENSLSIDTAKPSGPIPLSKAELARQKKEAAKKASAAKRKPSAKHNPADPFCVCAYCLGYENS